MAPKTATRQEWLAKRLTLLGEEKTLTRQRDKISVARRDLPWVLLDTPYMFEGEDGRLSLADLFNAKSQLVIYHFMYGADWKAGCPSCSFWIDNIDGVQAHLAARDTTLALVSSASLATLTTYKKRMGWSLPWYSSQGSDFNADFGVSFETDQKQAADAVYNYRPVSSPPSEMPGISVFAKDKNGSVYHTYSTYSRGLDMLNGAYHLLDLTPKGRDEADLKFAMSWLKRTDEYA